MGEDKDKIKLFEEKRVRTMWDEEAEKWWFSVIDVCSVLTDSDYQVARNYWKWLKGKLNSEGSELVSNTNRLRMQEYRSEKYYFSSKSNKNYQKPVILAGFCSARK
ncbi:MAG: hypothetical protein FWD92_06875 [Methanomassiliicoccaceae archaeon]|nr:hypothetical protein [Methanomassiliicoccaceae archaeon]